MKKIILRSINTVRKNIRPGRKNERLERGQVLVIVALSVIVLTAIVGLTVDVGLLYLNHGKLRRAVDAAALAATAQFREGYDTDDLQRAALEFLVLNGINDPTARVETCKTNPGDPVLCTSPQRKLVRVHATSVVRLAFMSVLGIRESRVSATAVSEAASMDVILVIDSSDSMTYDADPGDPMRDPSQCNPGNECHPFREVKDAATAFVDQLYFPYDRVAIVTFDNGARTNLSFSDDKGAVLNAINALGVVEPDICPKLEVGQEIPPGPCRLYERDPETFVPTDINSDGVIEYYGFDCLLFHDTGNPSTCGTTSIGRGLYFAGNEFGNKDTFREEALWVVILLTDGAANGPSYTCPNNTWTNPYCRDLSPTTRHCYEADDESCLSAGGVYWPDRYDADDYARDMADFVSEDQNALIFTIGLGNLVRTSEPRARLSDPTTKCDSVEPIQNCLGSGEMLMQYAADVGLGKYYYAPSGNQLRAIFLDIAQYLATRLTQ